MGLDAALALGDGKQDLGDPVADVILHHIFHIESCYEDAHDGEEQVGEVEILPAEVLGEEDLEEVDGAFQQPGSQGSSDPHQETDEQQEVALLDMGVAPRQELIEDCFDLHRLQLFRFLVQR